MWSETELAILTKDAAEGLSASEIAPRVHHTRNAVIGKIKRDKIAWNYKAGAAKRQQERIAAYKADRGPTGLQQLRRAERLRDLIAAPAIITPEPKRRSKVKLLELLHHHCKFPIGDPRLKSFRWCGATRIEGKSYCPEHDALCCVVWTRRR